MEHYLTEIETSARLQSDVGPLDLGIRVHHGCYHLQQSSSDGPRVLTSLPTELYQASPKRIRSFLLGRWCAKKALRGLSIEVDEIGIGADGAPQWPPGCTGSITHTESFVWAATARSSDCLSLGIDSEDLLDIETAREIAPLVAHSREIQLCQPYLDENAALTLIFSGKESLYKALAPQVKTFFDFSDAAFVHLDPTQNTFEIELLNNLNSEYRATQRFIGQYAIQDSTIHTAIYLPNPKNFGVQNKLKIVKGSSNVFASL